MKWPSNLVIIRHAQSAYNVLRERKEADPDYIKFKRFFKEDHRAPQTLSLAKLIRDRYALDCSDFETPLSELGREQARIMGSRILSRAPKPDVIYISPYMRTEDTFTEMVRGGFDPGGAKIVHGEDRIREQEHGLSLLYSDWRVFQTFHPEQKELYDLLGPYWYQYPQGESVSMVRDRIRQFDNMLVREHAGETVYAISHHLSKLCIRANRERLSPEDFIRLDRHEKPINCGVTIYRGNPDAGADGRLELAAYNLRLY